MNKPIVKLTESDGNAFSVIGKTMKALRGEGYSAEQIEQYRKEATSGDYDNLLRVTMKWVEVE